MENPPQSQSTPEPSDGVPVVDRERRLRGFTVGAVIATIGALLILGLGLGIGDAAAEQDRPADDRSPDATAEGPDRTTAPSSTTTTEVETEVMRAELFRLDGADGDLRVTATVTIDPTWPGAIAVRVEATDSTGEALRDGEPTGMSAGIAVTVDGVQSGDTIWIGEAVDDCGGFDRDQAATPAQIDESRTVTHPSGPATLTIDVTSAECTGAMNRVNLPADIVFP